MKWLLKLEELAMFLLSIFLLWNGNAAWYWYLLILVGPDVGMLAYLINNNVGAVFYNIFHHKGIAIIIFMTAIYFDSILWQQIGIILFGHSSWDRLMGFGLKYNTGFGYTHLGLIGKTKKDKGQ